jgi:hypothetical protein
VSEAMSKPGSPEPSSLILVCTGLMGGASLGLQSTFLGNEESTPGQSASSVSPRTTGPGRAERAPSPLNRMNT